MAGDLVGRLGDEGSRAEDDFGPLPAGHPGAGPAGAAGRLGALDVAGQTSLEGRRLAKVVGEDQVGHRLANEDVDRVAAEALSEVLRCLVAGRGGPDQGPRLGRGLHPQRQYPAGHGEDQDAGANNQRPPVREAHDRRKQPVQHGRNLAPRSAGGAGRKAPVRGPAAACGRPGSAAGSTSRRRPGPGGCSSGQQRHSDPPEARHCC